ncbi:flagellar brake protein [Desulfothermobacter acidiphilus]|uniref:flagellar brake protein n=1 Tax=Desulfothermobacter acidiphilus TaxID=1938353 RepID=UPI003F8C9C37
MPEGSQLPELTVSQRVQVARAGEEDYYVSTVEDITDEAIFIALPYRQRSPLMLEVGDRVKVLFPGESECFWFSSTVRARLEEGKVILYALTLPTTVKRVQRRRDVRLYETMPVEFAPYREGEEPAWQPTLALDLSAGGVRIASPRAYEPGSTLWVRFRLPLRNEELEIATPARVARCEPVVLEGKRLYHLGLEFLQLSRSQKDKIFSYVFWRMMEKRRLS